LLLDEAFETLLVGKINLQLSEIESLMFPHYLYWTGKLFPLGLLLTVNLALAIPKDLSQSNLVSHQISQNVPDPWQLYRQGQIDLAEPEFTTQLQANPNNWDALTGLGYIAYRQEKLALAEERFHQAIAAVPDNIDALVGLGLVLLAQNRNQPALNYFQQASRLTSQNNWIQPYIQAAKQQLSKYPLPKSKNRIIAKTQGKYLAIPKSSQWQPLFIKGVNLGVALPGKFPSEFPTDKQTYDKWLELISAMGANTIRTYTILPPQFYQALKAHNLKYGKNRKLWLIQGVWTELPSEVLGKKNDNYSDPRFEGQFVAEMQRVVDLIHGQANLPLRPGHASGKYTADVSDSTLAYLIGREWEPFSVLDYNQTHPQQTRYQGKYLQVRQGNPMEVWLTKIMDKLIIYEMQHYKQQRPISYTNWPTLDPLFHITESSKVEESRLRRELGIELTGESLSREVLEYDNDKVQLDMNVTTVNPGFQAGIYATYHAYPYYPDFMLYSPQYSQAKSPLGKSNYYGYFQDLQRHHPNIPVLIAEFGVPTSREIAHLQPQGWHHGGHTETAQAEIDARLFQEIFKSQMAGGIVFAWMDEWFKKNWMFIDYELPPDRNQLWYNAQDPEQNFGIMGMHPGKSQKVILDGNVTDWQSVSSLYTSKLPSSPLQSFAATSDEGYLYLRVKVGKIDWNQQQIWIGIDTYNSTSGSFVFPGLKNIQTQNGSEFLLQLKGDKTSKLLVHTPYSLFRGRYSSKLVSSTEKQGEFIEIEAEPNRLRVGRNRQIYPAKQVSRSNLQLGSTNRSATNYNSLADWNYNSKTREIEVRLPWSILNVTDPSSHQVYHFDKQGSTITTPGFRFNIIALQPSTNQVLGTFPKLIADGQLAPPQLYRWDKWEEPTYHSYLKPAYRKLQQLLPTLRLARKRNYNNFNILLDVE
jgi:tetratricopeptide (TPR) repeat protein